MLGTHSEPFRGQMSHICDISALRVKRRSNRVAFVHKDVLIHTIYKKKPVEEVPEDLMAYCIEKSEELVSLRCTCSAHKLLSITDSIPFKILLGELQHVNLSINDQNRGELMLTPNTRFPNCSIHKKFCVACIM